MVDLKFSRSLVQLNRKAVTFIYRFFESKTIGSFTRSDLTQLWCTCGNVKMNLNFPVNRNFVSQQTNAWRLITLKIYLNFFYSDQALKNWFIVINLHFLNIPLSLEALLSKQKLVFYSIRCIMQIISGLEAVESIDNVTGNLLEFE